MRAFNTVSIKMFIVMIAFIAGGLFSTHAEAGFCWKDSYGRGVGAVPDKCSDADRSLETGLCYKKCKPGEDAKVTRCYTSCPAGMRDDGLFCAKGAPATSPAYPWIGGDALDDKGMFKRCQDKHGSGNCEKNGLIVYQKCAADKTRVGADICSPKCPNGFADAGISCTKPSYERGAGIPPTMCSNNRIADAGLCYNGCREKFDGVGPVCWGQCPANSPVQCGMGCAATSDECALAITDQVVGVLSVIGNAVATVATFGGSTVAMVGVNAGKAAAIAGAKAGVASAARNLAGNAAKQGLNGGKEAIKKSIMTLAKEQGKAVTEAQAEQMARGAAGEDWDPSSLDPTGIAGLVQAYNKPICGKNGK